MRSETVKRILERTPEHIRISTHWYADLMLHISNVLKQKGISQKELAAKMGKQPSEISKWLKGEHNFTLSSLAKLQAELGVTLLEIPVEKKLNRYKRTMGSSTYFLQKAVAVKSKEHYNWQKEIVSPDEVLCNVG